MLFSGNGGSIRLLFGLLLFGGLEELRGHGLSPAHLLLATATFSLANGITTTFNAICQHLLLLVLLSELICHAIVNHTSW